MHLKSHAKCVSVSLAYLSLFSARISVSHAKNASTISVNMAVLYNKCSVYYLTDCVY